MNKINWADYGIWKAIEGWETYEVSSLGYVRRLEHDANGCHRKAFLVKQWPSGGRNSSYLKVMLSDGSKQYAIYVHRLVGKAFVEGYYPGAEINHKDENGKNNVYTNLEWCSRKYNCNYGTGKERAAKALKETIRRKHEH